MKKLRTFTQLALLLIAVCVSGNLIAQTTPVPLLQNINDWTYATNAGETQSIEVIPISTAPAGIGIDTENIFKHTSFNIEWGAWWWVGAIYINEPVTITEATKTLKFKVYSDTPSYYFIIKNSDGTAIMVQERAPVEPNTWCTIEMDLTPYIGYNIKAIEFVPEIPGRVIYFYPYFEDPTPQPAVTAIGNLKENMTEADFTFTANNGNTPITIVDPTGLNVPDNFVTKVFKVSAGNDPNRAFWWNSIINLNEAQVVPANQNTVLVAKVLSPNNQMLLIQKSDDGSVLNTAYNWGQRNIVPDQWNEIVMDYITTKRDGYSFLQSIELSTFVGNIDLYAYFYWATKTTTAIKKIEPAQKNIKIQGNQIFVDGALNIKQYTVAGKLVNTSRTGFVKAMDGLNIIVADGVAYKVFYDRK